jgi:hypothetical protein
VEVGQLTALTHLDTTPDGSMAAAAIVGRDDSGRGEGVSTFAVASLLR